MLCKSRLAPIICGLSLALAACGFGGKATTADPISAEKSSEAFMVARAREPGVVKTPSGLLYKVLASGPTNGPHPGLRDEVKIDYVGQLPSGEVFDSTSARGVPAVLRVGDLVPAWQEALPLMRPGDAWILYVPPKLGYGAEGAGSAIPPNSALVFKIKLLGVLEAGPAKV